MWRSLRKRGLAFSAVASALALTMATQGAVTTEASWNDSEWTSAEVGTISCADPAGQLQTRGEGQFLSGSLLGIDLDNVAEVNGVEVTNDGVDSEVDPDTAAPAQPEGAYANPLTVDALDAIRLDFGQVLQLPLNNNTGALGQYASASDTGEAVGASGLVTDTGGIALEPANGYPELATLQLSDLVGAVNEPVADLLAGVADVSLEVGAVAGRTSIDGCNYAWSDDVSESLTREYLAASLETVIESPTVGALVTGVSEVIDDVDEAVTGLAGPEGALDEVAGSLETLLNTVLLSDSQLSLGEVRVDSLVATINLEPVKALLTDTLSDSEGVLTIDLSSGEIRVDTAALLTAAYPDQYDSGLNGLAPNTNILAEPEVASVLTDTLGAVLQGWITRVSDSIMAAVDGIALDVATTIDLAVTYEPILLGDPVRIHVGTIALSIDGSLQELLSGESVVSAEVSLLDGLPTLVTVLLNGILAPLLTGLVEALLSNAGAIVGQAVEGVLVPTVDTLLSTLTGLASPVVSAVSQVYTSLFLDGVVSITVNAQNDPSTGSPEPGDWSGLPEGRFDVAALRVGVLDALGNSGVNLYLGRGSVGPVCVAGSGDPVCAGY